MIDVIDYRAGNAPSVVYALEHLGLPARLAATPAEVATAERIILPGVGAARATIDSLVEQDLVGALGDRVRGDRMPFLGICIGLQVLFDHSEEGDTDGLGWVPGTVRRFPDTDRVPQIGWNQVRFTRPHPAHRRRARRRPLLLRELLLLRAPATPATRWASPTTPSSSVRWSRATTSSPPSSTRRRAARSGSRSCAPSPTWVPAC